jgi:hypothetical protein
MELGQRRESVAVSATAETLKTQDASLGEVVEPRSIQELPLNGRMLLDLALTVPGAHPPECELFPIRWCDQYRSDV